MAQTDAVYVTDARGLKAEEAGIPLPKGDALALLNNEAYVFLNVEIGGKGHLQYSAHAEYEPPAWRTSIGWAAQTWPVFLGFIPALLLAVIISLLGGKFGDGSGNESGLAHFFGLAWVIGLVLMALIVASCGLGLFFFLRG